MSALEMLRIKQPETNIISIVRVAPLTRICPPRGELVSPAHSIAPSTGARTASSEKERALFFLEFLKGLEQKSAAKEKQSSLHFPGDDLDVD